jgi:chemotaxis protein CheD
LGKRMENTSQEIFVNSGEINACRGNGILHAGAIGSCVVVVAYDPDFAVGGMAHVMLPGESPDPAPSVKTKYAKDAVEEMMRVMLNLGATDDWVQVCLVGGGNVLGAGHDSPGPDIVRSLTGILGGMGITPVAMDVGGTQRRSCTLHVSCGRVTYTVGDSEQRTLWDVGRVTSRGE